MAEILYRDDVHKFSVYRLRDIPDGVPRSGWVHVARAVAHFARRSGEITNGHYKRETFAEFRWMSHADDVCCAVLDEHAGPLLAHRDPKIISAEIYGMPPFHGPGYKHGRNQTGESGPCEPDCRKCSLEAELKAALAAEQSTNVTQPKFIVGMRVVPSAFTLKRWPGARPACIAEIRTDGYLRMQPDANNHGVAFYEPEMWEPDPMVAKPQPPTENLHRECTRNLGAQRGEQIGCKGWPSHASAAWSAHLRFLVERSEQERRDREPSVLMPHDED